MSEWKQVTIEDICEKVCVGFVGTYSNSQTSSEHGIPMIRTTNLTEQGIDFTNLTYVTSDFHLKNKKSQLLRGDILVARHGDNGKACMFKNNFPANCLNVVILRPDAKKVNPLFFLYQFNSPASREIISQHSTGSVQDVVNTKSIAKLNFNLPPFKIQQAIAEVLSSLDDKIDLLHRNNKTLEEMAETLFRQWFVEGIPSNTPETNIYEYVKIEYGFPFSSKKFNEKSEGTQLIRIRDISKGFSNTYTTELANEIYIINQGDLLVGMDGEFRIHIWGGSKAWLNQRVCRVKPLEGTPPLWAYFMMKPHLNFYEQTKGGTTVIHIGKSDFDEIRIPIPQRATLDKYNTIVQPLFMKILSNYSAITHCTALRNTLLPKLMSGQVRVKF